MTDCNGCGSCCDPVVLPYTQDEARRLWRDQLDAEDLRWTLEDLIPMSRREAKAKEPWLFGQRIMGTVDEPFPFFYRCRYFDDDTRQCSNYDNRPPICRSWPWRGGIPVRGTALPPTCSYRADIGQSVAVRITPKP